MPSLTLRTFVSSLIALAMPAGSCLAAPSFQEDVMAALSKAGCNLGTCHGNATGKGGFKLSLRGQDPLLDHIAMVMEADGRRINTFAPDESLLLLKATNKLAHEGGKRIDPAGWEYQTLREWIANGAEASPDNKIVPTKLQVSPGSATLDEKASTLQLRVRVTYSDGTEKDITPRAVYEPLQNGLVEVSPTGLIRRLAYGEPTVLVRYLNLSQPVRLLWVAPRKDYAWKPVAANNYIDREIFAKLRALRIEPSGLADDSVFLRRVYLDLLGHLPSAEEARGFIADNRPDKRCRLVDALLSHPHFVDFWTMKWADLLKVESRTLDSTGMKAFHAWIRESVRKDKPLDRFAAELIASRGSTYHEPASNYYRANRTPVDRAVNTAQVFLGTRLQCAQCHNHPFDRWTQDDYYGWTALFARVDYKILSDIKPKDKSDKHEFNGEQVVFLKDSKDAKVENPRTGDPAAPRLLGASLPKLEKDQDELKAAAAWLANPKNELFAKAQANRIWYHLMGRGLVDPVDDFRLTNPASHPALLDALASDLVHSGFSLRHLIRSIVLSRAYQLDSTPTATNRDDTVNYSHNLPRRLTAEQLFDSLHLALGVAPSFEGSERGMRASQKPGPINGKSAARLDASSPESFLAQFGKPARQLVCECERTSSTSLSQAFQLISGPLVTSLISRRDNQLKTLGDVAAQHPGEAVQHLYWQTLSRAPTAMEDEKLTALLKNAKDKRAVLEDLCWSLVNAKEYLLRP